MLTNELEQGELYHFPKWFEKMYDSVIVNTQHVPMRNIANKPLLFVVATSFRYQFICEGKSVILRPNQIRHLEEYDLEKKLQEKRSRDKKNKKVVKDLTTIMNKILKKNS